jgi:hypothetical protein
MHGIFKGIKAGFSALIFEKPIIKAFREIGFKDLKDRLKGFKRGFKYPLKDFQKIAQKHQKSQPRFFRGWHPRPIIAGGKRRYRRNNFRIWRLT